MVWYFYPLHRVVIEMYGLDKNLQSMRGLFDMYRNIKTKAWVIQDQLLNGIHLIVMFFVSSLLPNLQT